MDRLLFSQKYMYELFLDKDGNYFFDVVVTWIGWFTKRVQLSEEQIKQYQEKGEEYLNKLSSEVNAQGILEARKRMKEYESSQSMVMTEIIIDPIPKSQITVTKIN